MVRYGTNGGTLPVAIDSTRNGGRRDAAPPPPTHSCRVLQGLTGFGLPVGEEIADIDVRFQLSFFLVSQRTFVSPGV
jgi:hypothetical protein